jgi:hypothetical protein
VTYDALTRVSNNQSLIGLGLAVSDGAIPILTNIPSAGPLGAVVRRNIGNSAHLVFRLHVTQTISGGGFTSLTATLLAAQTDNLLVFDALNSVNVTAAKCVAGAEFDLDISSANAPLQLGPAHAFLGILYTMNGGAPTAGAISAFIPLHDSPSPVPTLGANYTGPS